MGESQIGEMLAKARETAGIEQAEAARLAKIHPQTLSKYERGVIKKVPIEVLQKLAGVYMTTVQDLMSGKAQTLSRSVPRGTVSEFAPDYGGMGLSDLVMIAGRPEGVNAKLELFKREMIRAGADDAEVDYITETFRRPETVRLAHHDSEGNDLTPKQTEDQYDALIDGVRHIITRRIERRRKASKSK